MDVLGAVIGQQLCSPDETHLTVARKVVAITGGSFVVTDDKGNDMFTVKEKLQSLHGRHVLADAQGNIIVTFKKKMQKQHTFGAVVIGKDTYSLIVYSNVDYAFIVALVVILHEINEDKVD